MVKDFKQVPVRSSEQQEKGSICVRDVSAQFSDPFLFFVPFFVPFFVLE